MSQNDFTAWRQRFAAKTASVEDYVAHLRSRHDLTEDKVKAFVSVDWESAMIRAQSATNRYLKGASASSLDGLAFGIKDIIETANFCTQMQSPVYNGFQARRNAPVVSALLKMGGIIVGKTVTQEFACGMSGPTRNPHDYERTPGGSSSGSAAAVAAGMVPFALGTQTRASTIRPASYCGVYALKPTRGVISLEGTHPVAPSFDTVGLFANSLRDLKAFSSALAAYEEREERDSKREYRILAVRTSGMKLVDAELQNNFTALIANTPRLKADMWDHPAALAFDAAFASVDNLFYDCMCAEMEWPYGDYLDSHPGLLSAEIASMVDKGRSLSPAQRTRLQEARQALYQTATAALEKYDALISLSAAGVAPKGLDYTGSRSFSIPWSLYGGPSLSTPRLSYAGLPVGIQIMAGKGREDICFAIADTLENTGEVRQ